ncbi:3'(2'),5'-bisphosphate nucleotidase CysQ [Poriferisphaera corsica]|uniref:3'(2'),5'-bisphosphate nucleotidase n=1 Tax=Poriferisphaera corsica TaxID=2528020 RepID=A0A517YR73_9BACT|nr:3'(2'),5'-bisphosphate nucleotidase [Poriferisphaera corsica]QDU32727.1 3'(2'),5'-bisphosphate nucleotidase CysQ [Poriferisphaera corsica]
MLRGGGDVAMIGRCEGAFEGVYIQEEHERREGVKGSAMSLTMDMSHEFEVAVTAVQAAKSVCRQVQRDLVDGHAMDKQDKSPVTVADYASQALICGVMGESFEGIAIVGEEDAEDLRKEENAGIRGMVVEQVNGMLEEGVSEADVLRWIDFGNAEPSEHERYWTLDPIDGTKGFLRKQQYAIALGQIFKGEVVMGILGCPNMDILDEDAAKPSGLLITAIRGQGACMVAMDQQVGDAVPLRVSEVSELKDARLCESVESGHSDQSTSGEIAKRLGIVKEPYRIDSQCKYAAIARGDAEVYLRLPTRKDYEEKIWDHAAGMIAVEEAGGVVTDIYGKKLDFGKGKTLSANRGIVATNGRFHNEVVKVVGEVLGL